MCVRVCMSCRKDSVQRYVLIMVGLKKNWIISLIYMETARENGFGIAIRYILFLCLLRNCRTVRVWTWIGLDIQCPSFCNAIHNYIWCQRDIFFDKTLCCIRRENNRIV